MSIVDLYYKFYSKFLLIQDDAEKNQGIRSNQTSKTLENIQSISRTAEEMNNDRNSSKILLENLEKYKDIEQKNKIQSPSDKIKDKISSIRQTLTAALTTIQNKAQNLISKKPINKNKGHSI